MKTRAAKSLYLQVIAGVVAGILLGHFEPKLATEMAPFGTMFVRLVRMVVAPLIFMAVAGGIARMSETRSIGRLALKSMLYFEVMATFAAIIGLSIALLVRPGSGMNIDPTTLDTHALNSYTSAHQQTVAEFFLHIVPENIVASFATGDVLQVFIFAVFFGIALARMGSRGKVVVSFLDECTDAFFKIIGMVMRFAPFGAFGAMAFTIGRYGIGTLTQLGLLIFAFYAAGALFVVVVFGIVARFCGVRLFQLLAYLKEEFFVVLGTGSSEAVLPTLMDKLERLGCERSVVGFTVPLGYAFNLDGTAIYYTMSIVFVSQALNIHLSLGNYSEILVVLLFASKGAAAVAGSGFITMVAVLEALHGSLPVSGLVLLLGIDKFMGKHLA